jgi:hypothetical protein
VLSPDGKYSFFASVNRSKTDPTTYLCVVLSIHDSRGVLMGEVQTGASSRSRWQVLWDSSDRIWLDSADIGTYYWELQPDGQWKRFSYVEQQKNGGTPTPPFTLPNL